jgi:hypothetical protein
MLALLTFRIELQNGRRVAQCMRVLRSLGAYAAAVALRFRNFAPYAVMALVVPGGSLMAPLLWLYRRQKKVPVLQLTGQPAGRIKPGSSGVVELMRGLMR